MRLSDCGSWYLGLTKAQISQKNVVKHPPFNLTLLILKFIVFRDVLLYVLVVSSRNLLSKYPKQLCSVSCQTVDRNEDYMSGSDVVAGLCAA